MQDVKLFFLKSIASVFSKEVEKQTKVGSPQKCTKMGRNDLFNLLTRAFPSQPGASIHVGNCGFSRVGDSSIKSRFTLIF